MRFEGCIVAVHDLDSSSAFFAENFGVNFGSPFERPGRGIRTTIGRSGTNTFQLMSPTAEGPLAKFLERQGEGVYGLVFTVDDIESELRKRTGRLQPIGDIAELPDMREVLYHPRDCHGVLTVIRQWR